MAPQDAVGRVKVVNDQLAVGAPGDESPRIFCHCMHAPRGIDGRPVVSHPRLWRGIGRGGSRGGRVGPPPILAGTLGADGTGSGGSPKPDLKAEFSSEPHLRGVCSMARTSSPNSANSQFFICLDDATFLDRQYTVWGVVESGMDAVDALPKGEPPRNPGKIVTARSEA